MQFMQIGNRFRCYPTEQQAQVLLQWIGAQRFIYNAKVSEDRYFRRFAHRSLSHTGEYAPIDQQYAQFKTELTPWMKQIPSQVLRNGAVKWKQGYDRFFAKLAGRPTLHSKHGKQSVWLTSELFKFKTVESGYELHLGTKTKNLGVLRFKAHNLYQVPVTIHISIQGGRWFVSFNYDDKTNIEPKEEDTIAYLLKFSRDELSKMTVGIDRGVAIPLALSDGQCFGFSEVQQKRLAEQEGKKKRWQKIQAKRQQGSSNYQKAKRKVARYSRYASDVRLDMAHKASHSMVSSDKKLFVFESLKLKNMTKKPKAQQSAQGKWQRNGARAKAGLNKALLGSALGMVKTLTSYKAKRAGKLVLEVPAFYTSQECSQCGHIHPDNRLTQSEFICQRCGHTENADINAGKNIAKRGIEKLLSASKLVKQKKQVKKLGNTKVGLVESEPIQATVSTLGESVLDIQELCSSMRYSLSQETPTSTVG
jgi:putative transposase